MTGEDRLRIAGREHYRGGAAALIERRRACRRLLDEFNGAPGDADGERARILPRIVAEVGPGTVVLPRLLCDYGTNIRLGAHCFINYDVVLLDTARITIGDDVLIGPRTQLLAALHPVDDHEARRAGWESAAPITIGDNAWLGGGVLVCAGVSIGPDTVIGAGSVVTRDVPGGVFAAGNPCRVVRATG